MAFILTVLAFVIPLVDRNTVPLKAKKPAVAANWPAPVRLSAQERAEIINTFVYPWGGFDFRQ